MGEWLLCHMPTTVMWHKLEEDWGIVWPLSLFRAVWLLWMAMASFTFLLKSLSSLTSTFTPAKVYLWPVLEVWSVTVELGCLLSVCSLNITPGVLAVSPMYSFPHPSHFTLYTTPHCFSFWVLSLGLTKRDLRVLKGLWYEGTPWDLNTHWSCSDTSEM